MQEAEDFEQEGNLFEAVDKLESALRWLRQSKHPDQARRVSLKLNELCNLVAMAYLQKNSAEFCLAFLRKAQAYALDSRSHQSITFNNYACFYRTQNKLRVALKFLQQALDMLEGTRERGIADLNLNICAILSKMNRHQEAYIYSLKAVDFIQSELLNITLPFYNNVVRKADKTPNSKFTQSVSRQSVNENPENIVELKFPKPSKQRRTLFVAGQLQQQRSSSSFQINDALNGLNAHGNELTTPGARPNNAQKDENHERVSELMMVYCIALHNMAVELEYLGRWEESQFYYEKGFFMASSHFGEQSEISRSLKKVLDQAKENIQKKINEKVCKGQARRNQAANDKASMGRPKPKKKLSYSSSSEDMLLPLKDFEEAEGQAAGAASEKSSDSQKAALSRK